MDYRKELGVQSYCFRAFKQNQQVAEQVKKCGLTVIELCAGVHVNVDQEATFAGVVEDYRRAGVRIAGIYVGALTDDTAAMRKRFEFARGAGAKMLSASFDLDSVPLSYRVAERLADKYDINVAIHNHGGFDWLGNSQSLRHVFQNTSARIGLCLDTAWAIAAWQDPFAMAEEFASRMYDVHLKDFVFDRAGRAHDVVIGKGNLDVKKFLATLRKLKYRGEMALEYEGDIDNPVPALKQCAKVVEKENQ